MKKEIGIFSLLVVLCGVTAAMNPRFLSQANLTNMANVIGLFGVFSIGLGLVIITGGIDLSVGSMCALTGVLLAAGVPLAHAVEVVLIFRLITFWLPAVAGVLATRHLHRRSAL